MHTPLRRNRCAFPAFEGAALRNFLDWENTASEAFHSHELCREQHQIGTPERNRAETAMNVSRRLAWHAFAFQSHATDYSCVRIPRLRGNVIYCAE